MALPYRLPGGEPGIRGCKRKIGRGIAHPLGRRAPAASARMLGGLHKRRMATRGRLGRPDFSIAGGVKGNPFGPLKLRRLRRAKFLPVQRASAIVTDRRRRRRGGFVSACRARIERDPKETH